MKIESNKVSIAFAFSELAELTSKLFKAAKPAFYPKISSITKDAADVTNNTVTTVSNAFSKSVQTIVDSS